MGAEKKDSKEKGLGTLLLRIPDLAKAFSVSTKEITAILSGGGEEVKPSASIDPDQFSIVFEELTQKHTIKDIDAYLKGEVFVKTKVKEEPKEAKAPAKAPAKAATAEPEKAPAPAEPKKAPKPEPEAQDKPAQTPAAKAY